MTPEELDRIKRAEEIQRYTEIRCEALEKENAKLKKRNSELAGQKASLERWLGEAKKLIEDIYDLIPASHSDYYKDVMERARQFLKEV